jgi:hypothetical protein
MEIDPTFMPARAPTAYSVELDGEAVILDERRNHLHYLNRTATLIWNCLDGRASVEEIAYDLATAFGALPATMITDVLTFVRALAAEGLIARIDRGPETIETLGDTAR